MRSRKLSGLSIFFVLFLALVGAGIGISSPAHAQDTYRLVIIRVLYTDTTTPPYTIAQLTQAADEIEEFFWWLSNGNLDMTVTAVEANLSHPQSHYWLWDSVAGEWKLNVSAEEYTKDAVLAAAGDGLDFSNIDAVTVLTPFAGPNDWANGPMQIEWQPGVTRTFQRAYDFEWVGDPSYSPPGASGVWWGGWAHEIGHQLEFFFDNYYDLGHPAGYASGYDLMDSCYPCGDSSFALSAPPVVSENAQVFPGWLPVSKVVTVEAPESGTTGETVVLAPLSEDPAAVPAAQAIQIPIAPGHYYMVEARTRLRADSLNIGPGIWDEGVHILEVEESRTVTNATGDTLRIPVQPVNWCETYVSGGCVLEDTDPRFTNCWPGFRAQRGDVPDYCWPYPLWHPGETFYDSANEIEIRVDDIVIADAYSVTVTRGVPPGYPDVLVLPWLTPPTNTWESIDIWVDSSANGYEKIVGPAGLRYGRRPDGTVIGNGDDPLANHENRIYATIRNVGDLPANDIRVTFKVTDPMGVGVRDPLGWTVVGTVTQAEFPSLASLAPKASTDVYVKWIPEVELTEEQISQGHFSFHSCVQVVVDPVLGEIVTSNQDGIEEQENIDNFEARLDPATNLYDPLEEEFYISNRLNFPRDYYLMVESNMPEGWSYLVAGGKTSFTLNPGVHPVPVQISVPAGYPIGKAYHLKVKALTTLTTRNKAIPEDHPLGIHKDSLMLGGVVLEARTVQKTHLTLYAQQDMFGNIVVFGQLTPARQQPMIAVDYTDPSGYTMTKMVAQNASGFYRDVLIPQIWGGWTMRAIWQGDLAYSSAVSDPVSLKVGRVCSIATAAYGSYLDAHVETLRHFRDTYLVTNAAGRAFLRVYYRTSPPIAEYLREHETLRRLTRWILSPMVYGIAYPGIAAAIVLGIFMAAFAVRLSSEKIGEKTGS